MNTSFLNYFKGVKDDKERYYRIIIEETPVTSTYKEDSKQPLVVPTVGLNP